MTVAASTRMPLSESKAEMPAMEEAVTEEVVTVEEVVAKSETAVKPAKPVVKPTKPEASTIETVVKPAPEATAAKLEITTPAEAAVKSEAAAKSFAASETASATAPICSVC